MPGSRAASGLKAGTVLLGLLAGGGAAAGAADLDGLLGRLGPQRTSPAGDVEVVAWVERGAGGTMLMVRLEPNGAARVLADPGITVTAAAGPEVDWSTPSTYLGRPEGGYFTEPPMLGILFEGEPAAVSASVDYAWCLVDYQCLFGAATVTATVPTPSSTH